MPKSILPLLLHTEFQISGFQLPTSVPKGAGAAQRCDQRRGTQRLGRRRTVAADAADVADHAGGGILDGETIRFCWIFMGVSYDHMISNDFH